MQLHGLKQKRNHRMNKLIIAAAGSGKTAYVIRKSLEVEGKKVLLTTYTQANKEEIADRIRQSRKGIIPEYIDIETWFSFLLRHGVKPYQGSLTPTKIKGLLFVNQLSMIGTAESDTNRHYLSNRRLYSDKLAKFAVRSNDASNGSVMNRLSQIYDVILIDEVQDMSGYDLEILEKLFDASPEVILVGDPRQATYVTHPDSRYKQYQKGGIVRFIEEQCLDKCVIDYSILGASHRNHVDICLFSSLIYPEYPTTEPCKCEPCREYSTNHLGVFLVPSDLVDKYVQDIKPIGLRWQKSVYPDWNFGLSKGKTFDNVLVYPTSDFEGYLLDGILEKVVRRKGKQAVVQRFDRSKLYVACTRPRYSLGIVCSSKTISKITTERLNQLHAQIYT